MTRDFKPSLSHASQAHLSDQETIEAVLDGDTDRYELLMRRYNQRLFRVGMGYLNNHMDAEDAMQETYLKAFRKLRLFRREADFSTWLTRIMINECLMALRRRKRKRAESLDAFSPEHIEALGGNQRLGHFDSDEAKALLETCVARLPRNYRVVYLLREAQNLSTAETAESLEISEQNVKVRLHRAREALKTLLLETADERELFAFPAPFCNPFTQRVMTAISSEARRS